MSQPERIVVVGAGLAGLRAAERLRELGFNGELMIIGEEALPPYHRPALSKQLLTGAMRPDDLMLPAYREVGARWRLRTQAGFLLPRKRIVRLPGGEEIRYDGLVIATGVEARRPNDVPYDHPRVLVMRTLPDALALERAISSSRGPVAVVGGGFTGCEIAASLRHMGRDVTIIGRAPNLLGNVLGPKLGAWLTNLHGNHGVDLALGCSVKHWEPEDDRIGLALSDGSSMTASCVVIAAGTEPSTNWLRGSGLPLDNGVVCESTCHVVGADDVVAAGDVAQWPNIRFDAVPRRIEHWLNAVEMGRAAAESLLAGRAAAVPFTPMPRFWTEQYGVRIMAAGVPKLGTDTITLGTPDAGTGTVVGYVREGRLMGVVGVDCPSSVLSWTEKVCEQNPVPTGVPQSAPAVQAAVPAPVPVPAPAPADPPAAASRKRAARHSLDARTRQAARSADSNTRMRPVGPAESYGRLTPVNGRPVESNARMRPVGPADSNGRLAPVNGRPGPMDSSTRIPPAGTNGHMPPPGSLGRLTPVNGRPGPAESNPRMRPVGPADSYGRLAPVNGRPGPMDSSSRIPPVGTNGHVPPPGPVNGRPGPAESNPRMRPVGPADSNARLAPVNGRPGPMDSSTRIPPAGTNGRIPIPPIGSNGRTIPAGTNGHTPGTNGRIPPVGTNGHSAGPNGRIAPTEITSFLHPIDIGGRLGPANTPGPVEPNGHSAGPNGHSVGTNGRIPIPPPGTNSRIPPVGANGHSAGTNGRIPPVGSNGHSAGINGRIPPVANGHSAGANGHSVGTNGRIPIPPPGTNGRIPPVGANGHSAGTNGRIPPVGNNGHSAAANGRIIPASRNGHSVGTNGRVHPMSGNHSAPPPVDDVEVTGWISRRDW